MRQPEGLRSLTVVCAPAASRTFQQRQCRLHEQLWEDVRATHDRHQSAGTVEHPEYVPPPGVGAAPRVPSPTLADFLERAYAGMSIRLVIRIWIRELTDWDIRPRLGAIRAPTLIVADLFDGQEPGEEVALH